MIKELNLLLAGVGGQGTILMSELLGDAAVHDGVKVRGSEVLGMAVRGGSVFSSIRLGSDVYAPLPAFGKCDIMVSLEPSEAVRNITYLAKAGLVILNTAKVIPYTVSIGASKYPSLEAMLDFLKGASGKTIALDATSMAREAGSVLTTNIVMLGALFGTQRLPIKVETIKEGISGRFPEKVVPLNIKAFDLGYQASKQALQ